MSKKILIVEDTETLLKEMQFFLTMESFEVFPFADPISAYAHLSNNIPDLIITDLTMPKMDGFDFIRQIRQSPSLTNVPVAVFSARPFIENKEMADRLGVAKYISKPATLDLLLEEINHIINPGTK